MPAQESPAAGVGEAGETNEVAEAARGSGPPPPAVVFDPEDPEARSPRVRMAAAAVTVLLLVGVAFHLLFVFLHVAPENRASREYQEQTRDWIYPVFEQNWHLFAPDPLNTNTRVNARVQYRSADGTVTTSEWMDLTGDDVAHIRGNPFPSKADQNLLRRAWEFYSGSHDSEGNRTTGRAELAEEYLRRIVVKRMQADGRADGIVAVQIRAVLTPIGAPDAVPPAPTTREFVWWETRPDDFR
ncbi:DUF5819 family protein [Yinghuangia sp. ASG 101]|uniref:DUF5819 family protein n=1 Tax=Yinghuangia sp. ASG 101 TaxID=2896848 RepID=UPI001E423F2C|nr:DUF5819 family protein [Yinghuangia sp. ASG 101]UGQ15238.1 DUF5819 family protein [Yinghuangia sp. ASG 101]